MLVGVVLAEIARDDEEHGTRPPRAKLGEGATQVVGDEVRAIHLAHPFGDGSESLGHVVVRVPAGALPHALGNHEERR